MVSGMTASAVEELVRECERMAAALELAEGHRWARCDVPRPRVDTTERSKGDVPADPTADLVLDERRMAVADSIRRAESVLRTAAIFLQAARADVDHAVTRFDGELTE